MSVTIKKSGVSQIPKGERLFEEGTEPDGIFILVKGKAVLFNSNVRLTAGSGDFLDLWDVYAGQRLLSCIALEDMTVYAFPVKKPADLELILESNNEYCGRITASLGHFITELYTKQGAYLSEDRKSVV